MKPTTWLLLISILSLSALWPTSCLTPKPPPIPGMADIADCVPPKSAVAVMHEQPDIAWPAPRCRERAKALLSQMSLEEKIAQMAQPDRGALSDAQVIASLGLGSVLAGGSTDPNGGNSPADWAGMVRQVHEISLESKHRIPALFGVDAVHGHNNVQGAVIFPHNIGLGCTRNPDLMERIGRVTAEEIAATGIDWTFAPVFAAARDERWGRTYEAFGETPELAAELGTAMVRGLQGERLGAGTPSVLACAKHFAGDGGTVNGLDQGNTEGDIEGILERHVAQFRPAVAAGVGSVMASYSSVNSVRMHCHGPLLTDTLKREMGFNGFVISDWQAIHKLPGRYEDQLADAINAGIDMVMAPKSPQLFINTVKGLVPDDIPEARIDDAAGRILSVKCELGMLDETYFPKDDSGRIALDEALLKSVGSKAHRAVARQAVRESLVLLKNDGVLPLGKSVRIHVAGKNADNLGHQCGGWTISWQGSSGRVAPGTTVLAAIRNAVSPTGQGPEVTYSEDGAGAEGAGVAVAVIGEKPYAEGNGDRKDISVREDDLEVLRRLKAAGIPLVVVLISGRPMILGEALELADAFVAAWLPGTEGDGVADVLFGDSPPTGRLGHSWPRRMEQIPINLGDADYDPLFPYGFGLSYSAPKGIPAAPPEAQDTIIPTDAGVPDHPADD